MTVGLDNSLPYPGPYRAFIGECYHITDKAKKTVAIVAKAKEATDFVPLWGAWVLGVKNFGEIFKTKEEAFKAVEKTLK